MTFFRRLRLYIIGVGLGTIMVYFFFKDRNFDAWLPEGRVLEGLQRSEISIGEQAACQVKCIGLNDDWLTEFLKNGDVIFSKSNTRKEPCPEYKIESTSAKMPVSIMIELCRENTARLLSVTSKEIHCQCE